MSVRLFNLIPALLCLALLSCKEHEPNSNVGLSLEYYQKMRNPNYAINSQAIRELMDSLMRNDGGTTVADQHTKRYYRNKGGFLWIDRHGVDHRADTLLAYLQRVGDMGFNPKHFFVKNIENDLLRLRELQLGEGMEDINHVLARLEYRLTKSYLRYAGGQRFGYVNPSFVLNRLDSIDPNPYDSIKRPVRYRGLYDVKIDHANDHFYLLALQQIVKSGKSDGTGDDQNAVSNSLTAFLHDVQPKSAFYEQLAKKLQMPGLGKAMRAKILVNMERCRWRHRLRPGTVRNMKTNTNTSISISTTPMMQLLPMPTHTAVISARATCTNGAARKVWIRRGTATGRPIRLISRARPSLSWII